MRLPLRFAFSLFLVSLSGGSAPAQVLLGIDVLVRDHFSPLEGKRIGLITNHTGRSRGGQSTIDLLSEAPNCNLVALFSPEHGIRGNRDTEIDSGTDKKTGLPIHSLYGKTRSPTDDMLRDLDSLVFDIQDIGTRFYTYIGTMALAMRSAAKHGIGFVVLDRPNPIGGVRVEGAVPPTRQCGGLTSIFPIATRHGMTVGELARMFNEEFGIGCDLTVIPMKGWVRSMNHAETGLVWIPTSPNMRTLDGALCYPGLGVLEGTRLSCGRGTERPFEWYGAPYLDARGIAEDLNRKNLPGVRFTPHTFTPTAEGHPFKGQSCRGVRLVLTDRDDFDPILTGLHFIRTVHEHHPSHYTHQERFATLIGDPDVWEELTREKTAPEKILERWKPALERFQQLRKKYLFPEYDG